MHRMLPATLLLMLVSSAVSAAEISQADFDYFKEETYSNYGELDLSDIEDQFYEIAKRTESSGNAVAEFAVALDVSRETATDYVSALVAAVRYREECDSNRDYESCRFESGTTLYDALVDSGFHDQSGRIATSIGKAIQNYTDEQQEARSTYIRVVYGHPARASIYSRLYDYGRDIEYAAVLAATEPANVESAVLFRHEAQSIPACDASKSGTFLSLLEMARKEAFARGPDDSTYLIFTEALVWSQLRFGLVSDAVQNFREQSDALLRGITSAPPDFLEDAERLRYIRQNANFLLDIAYAIHSVGDSDEATDILAIRQELLLTHEVEEKSDAAAAAVLREIMSPNLSANELYEMAIYGRLNDDPATNDEDDAHTYDNDRRWLFAMARRSMLGQSVFADRLRDAGYDEMAGFLAGYISHRCHDKADPLASLEELLPDVFSEKKRIWASRIEESWNNMRESESAENEVASAVERRPQPLTIEEHNMPTGFLRPEQLESEGEEEYWEKNLVPENVYVPVDPASVVRFSEEQGERHIVFLSSAIDRPGEIPAYGFWYQSTFNGGRNWSVPLYLGLQQFFPYVVVADSRLPLIADGKLQIEVEVKEIDPASISFPPVGLGLKREEKNLYIAIDLDELERDSDEDYMTDVVEHRLGLDPTNPDTDGDGTLDGIDSLPFTAYNPEASREDTELGFAILETILGYERAALMVQPSTRSNDDDRLTALNLTSSRISEANSHYLVADPEVFAGIRLEDRLLVYTEEEIERISDGQAPFYPAKVSHLFRKKNGQEFYVIWSASWTGGQFVVRCSERECTVEETLRWIT
jgi:hypothetical protein